MDEPFDVRLLRRSLGQKRTHRSVKTLYGDKTWVHDLDIINELGGHTGCVNALSWSTGGSLLASGSDDTYLNIWEYNPVNLARPFTLNTSVDTGHNANIFSVKFMPHSNDRTVITCAGDSEVRVFDLEYGGGAQAGLSDTGYASTTRSRKFQNFFANAKWLNEGNTNARVYRSHADRAKRVVTESSPHLFLTCSEDGEVRQWDLRQPSSAYPAAISGRSFARSRRAQPEGSENVPPPLISYKHYNLDLNSISCAASQPQYIALGGAHLHCFLHDRRMLGRDLSHERGQPGGVKPELDTKEDEAMGEATRCVKRFAPNNKRKMSRHEHGHITACKISDANPNELIASWSGDHIYSFDIVKSPDARDAELRQDEAFQMSRTRQRVDRKRKRTKATPSSSILAERANPSQRLRRVSDSQVEAGHTALRVQYTNGEREDFPIEAPIADSDVTVEANHDTLLNEAQLLSKKVARSLVQLRETLFDFSMTMREEATMSMENSTELTPYTSVFTNALGQCANLLPEMEEVIRSWSYPINPSEEDVTLQNTLRRNRQASWRFVQASGCIARALGGTIQTLSLVPDPRMGMFGQIRPAAHEGKNIRHEARFSYDFLKAILCWLQGGRDAVLQAFKRPSTISSDSCRFPLDEADTLDNFVPKLHHYLSDLADDGKPITDIDANRFELDETRHVFQSQKAAVQAFTRALSEIRLELRQGTSELQGNDTQSSTAKRIMDKGAAARFWGMKVGRSLLMEAAKGVTFDFVNRAFGGLRLHLISEYEGNERSQEDIDPDSNERVIEAMDLVSTANVSEAQVDALLDRVGESVSSTELSQTAQETAGNSTRSDIELTTPPTVVIEDADGDADEVVDQDNEDNNPQEDSDDHASDDEEDDDDDDAPSHPLFRRRIGVGRSKERASVNLQVPYSSHSKVYKGHCNTRTVKDVNFYGLNDEYVVSGSDDGHFFIWDRKSTKIVNILEGDGEVVNVVQGHPCEPIIACSGIDSTVKVFGAGGGSRERQAAARGIDVANPGGSIHSSLRFGRRRSQRRADEDEEEPGNETQEQQETNPEDDEEIVKRGGLKSRRAMHKEYEITSQNDAERRRGHGDAFVTESMLARFAAALHRGQIQAIDGQGFGGGGGTIVVDDNCSVM